MTDTTDTPTVADDIAALDEQEGPDAGELMQQMRLRNNQLGGATNGLVGQGVDGRKFIQTAVARLMTCKAHGGAHHFAVTHEGMGLWISDSAMECLNSLMQPPEPRKNDPSVDASIPATSPRERCPKCGGVEIAPYRFDHSTDCPTN